MAAEEGATATEVKPSFVASHESFASDEDVEKARRHSRRPRRPRPERSLWRPSFWRIRPLLGMLAIAVSMLSMMFSALILVVSNGKPTVTWKIQPTVYLAVATAIANASLQCALTIAAPVSWLYKALRGSTVEDLEINWEAGQSFVRAFIKSRKYKRPFGLLGIASLVTALVLIDGALLQRSVSVKRDTITQDVNLNISVVDQLPRGFSGSIVPPGLDIPSHATIEIVQAQFHNQDIISPVSCNGTCSTTVQGPGLARMECTNRTWPINEAILRNSNVTWGFNLSDAWWGATYYPTYIKPILFSWVWPYYGPSACQSGREPLWVATGTANYENCEGEFTLSNCTLLPAVVEHDITIDGSVLTQTSPRPRVIALANSTCESLPDTASQPFAVGGIIAFLAPYFQSSGRLGIWDIHKVVKHGPVETWDTASFNAFNMKYLGITPAKDKCLLRTRDPMDDILTALNQIMLRAGFLAASWPNITDISNPGTRTYQVVQAHLSRDENIFHSDLRWFSGAACVQIFTALFILSTYYGWWKIGVELSLSPFHVGKLLDAPILSGINSGVGGLGVIREIGKARLKLGGVIIDGSTCHGPEGEVDPQVLPRTRIGIAQEVQVFKPQRGTKPTD